jgi:hypothetical protein
MGGIYLNVFERENQLADAKKKIFQWRDWTHPCKFNMGFIKNILCNHFPICKEGCPRIKLHLVKSLPSLTPRQCNVVLVFNQSHLLDNNLC